MLGKIKKFFRKKAYVVTGYIRRSADWDVGETWIDSVWLKKKLAMEYIKKVNSEYRGTEYKLHIITISKQIDCIPLTTDRNRKEDDDLCRLLGIASND